MPFRKRWPSLVEVIVPKLGLTMEEATVSRWLVADGERVTAGQTICEIETDKVTEEIEAEADGALRHEVSVNVTVPAGTVIGYIE
jgi:pyruvate/2-oxoglutarate dehydrogenase complex dihydrolipoamide acyltransferase (E2) component